MFVGISNKNVWKLGIPVVVVTALALVALGKAQAGLSADGVNVQVPVEENREVYLDFNSDGIHTENEYIGIVDVFNDGQVLNITWNDSPFEAVTPNASYRVSLRQYAYGVPVAAINSQTPYTEIAVAHHWASEGAVNVFQMGPFGFEGQEVVYGAVSYIVITPEVYTQHGEGDFVRYEYTALSLDALSQDTAAQIIGADGTYESEPFVFEGDNRDARGKEIEKDEEEPSGPPPIIIL